MTPVIAIPGTFCAPAIYERLQAALADRFAVQALSWMTDAPAWTIDAVAEWVADQIHEPALVVGHSTGGAIALRLAGKRPDLVRGLMVVNTGPNMHHHGDVLGVIASMERDGTAEVVPAVLDRSFHTPPTLQDRQRLLDYGTGVPLRAALEVLRSQHSLDLTPVLPSLRMPVAVVHGRFDRVRTVAEAKAMADAIPNARLYVVDAGHTPMYEAPETVAEALRHLVNGNGR